MKKRLKKILQTWNTNLTLRYVVGLSLIALLTISSQALIQIEMLKQKNDQEIVRLLSDLSNFSIRLRESIVSFQLEGRPYKRNVFIEEVIPEFQSIEKIHSGKISEIAQERAPSWQYYPIVRLEQNYITLKNAIDEILSSFEKQEPVKEELIDTQVKSLLEAEKNYGGSISTTAEEYEIASQNRLAELRFFEVLFMLFTLLVLVFEAFFIFKPAVQRANRALRVRSEFISRMSHEIRNPLNSILGMSSLLEGMVQSSGESRLIKRMQRSGRTLLSVLENILEFSNLGEGKATVHFEKTSIVKVVERSVELVSPQLSLKRLNCYIHFDPTIPTRIKGDYAKMGQIAFNLLNNAVKFTMQGHVAIEVRMCKENSPSMIELIVSDTGPGISKEKQEAIFDAFTQADESIRRKHGGVGLGLSIVKQLTKLLDGDVYIEESSDKGTRFVAKLPIEILASKNLAESLDIPEIKGKKVVFFTQDAEYQEAISKMISLFPVELSLISKMEELTKIDQNEADRYIIDLGGSKSLKKDMLEHFDHLLNRQNHLYLIFEQDFDNTLGQSSLAIHSEVAIKPLLMSDLRNFLKTGKLTQKLDASFNTRLTKLSLRLVIIDDDEGNLEIFEGFLKEHCKDFKLFSNAKEAVAYMKSNPFDLLLTDMEMPEINGFDVAQLVRHLEKTQKLKPHPILAASAYRKLELQENPLWRLFDGIIEKPIDKRQLLSVLQSFDNNAESKLIQIAQHVEPHLREHVPRYIERKKAALHKLLGDKTKLDLEEAKRFGHQLKGTAKNYGLEELGKMGADLEDYIIRGEVLNMQRALKDIELFFKELDS